MAAPASAQGLGGTINAGLAYGTIVGWGTQDLRVTIMLVIQVLLGFLGVVAILIILYAGWRWMTSGGDPQKIEEAKRTLVNAVLGLLVIFAAFAIVAFIIQMLSGAVGPQEGARRPPPTLPCFNCDALGAGILEYVYPEPGATDVPRNTAIIVAFKVPMKADTINDGGQISNQITITAVDSPLGEVPRADVGATTDDDDKRYTFDPKNYLGDGIQDVRYRVTLGCDIRKQDNTFAFKCENNTGFTWDFTVSTKLDFVPPQISAVFPPPDNDHDTYQDLPAAQATGGITVKDRPRTSQVSRVENLISETGSPTASFAASTYNCNMDAFVCVTDTFDINLKPITETSCAANTFLLDRGNWLPKGLLNGPRVVVLGCGITLQFNGDPGVGNLWHFQAFASHAADTLRVGQAPTYTFVDGVAPVPAGVNPIVVGPLPEWGGANWDEKKVASNIAAKLNAEVQSPDVDAAAAAGSDTVTLTAKVAGAAGNQIQIAPSGSWATVGAFKDGKDAGFQQTTCEGCVRDVARNAVPRIDFNEAMLPVPISGKVDINYAAADANVNLKMGPLRIADSAPYVTVQADIDDNDVFDTYEYVEGTFLISNRFQTAEFQAASLCGVCEQNGASCTQDADCPGTPPPVGSCKTIRNSCGDQIYCLPTVKAVAAGPNTAGWTHYKMTVRAANLFECPNPGINALECVQKEKTFPDCVGGPPNICHGATGNYPLAKSPLDGAVDAARNSLDGNETGEAQGPNSYYVLNPPPAVGGQDIARGDSVEWTFWVNNRLQLTPPTIKLKDDQDLIPLGADLSKGGIFPSIGESGVPITRVPWAAFEQVLMSSSLLPDNHYRDGRCYCDGTAAFPCRSDEVCDIGMGSSNTNTCRSKSGADNYCVENSECPSNSCLNRQHVTLVDLACQSGGRCSGWWIRNTGNETSVPPDASPDYTQVLIEHTPLAEFSQYSAEMGSGIKDLYQNCFLPSEGPSTTGAACNTSRLQPYCCNGVPSDSCP